MLKEIATDLEHIGHWKIGPSAYQKIVCFLWCLFLVDKLVMSWSGKTEIIIYLLQWQSNNLQTSQSGMLVLKFIKQPNPIPCHVITCSHRNGGHTACYGREEVISCLIIGSLPAIFLAVGDICKCNSCAGKKCWNDLWIADFGADSHLLAMTWKLLPWLLLATLHLLYYITLLAILHWKLTSGGTIWEEEELHEKNPISGYQMKGNGH